MFNLDANAASRRMWELSQECGATDVMERGNAANACDFASLAINAVQAGDYGKALTLFVLAGESAADARGAYLERTVL